MIGKIRGALALFLIACGSHSGGGADDDETPDASTSGCDACTRGASECVGDAVRVCMAVGDCTEWSVAEPCSSDTPFCSDEIGRASCRERVL